MQIIKPGSNVKDIATGIAGMVTHVNVETGNTIFYAFQPKGLNPETGHPLDGEFLVPARLEGGELIALPEIMDLSLLGSEATDEASGFTGVITAIILHISGCVHANVQPRGVMKKTGSKIGSCNFDLRRLMGPKIKKLTEKEREVDQVARPSPANMPRRLVS
jgi:hypothetical protein